MTLGIVAVVVFILLAVALLPNKPRHSLNTLAGVVSPSPVVNLRRQQLDEESTAIASEYRRLADEAWLAELRQKAAVALQPTATTPASK